MKKLKKYLIIILVLVIILYINVPKDYAMCKSIKNDKLIFDSIFNQVKLSEPRKVHSINIASYLKKELIWEMGSGEPMPQDFFEPEFIGDDKELTIKEIDNYRLETQITKEMLFNAGKYIVKINCNGVVIDGRLSVVDTIPPIIQAPEQIEYNIGDTILYKKDVCVTDNSGKALELRLDISDVKINVAGTYTIYYSAIDDSGNMGEAETKITIKQKYIPTKTDIDKMADDLLDELLVDGMSKSEQAKAIFEWCNSNIRNTSTSDKSSILQGAYDGMYNRAGDCYTFFATASYLMERCGISNLPVTKRNDTTTHYWSLVNTGEGWYHFDSSPHKSGYKCFMQTDAQVIEYAEKNENNSEYFCFDETDMPDRETKIVYLGE